MSEEKARFNKELQSLRKRLRVRAMLRAATWGAFIGTVLSSGLFAWLWIDEAFYRQFCEFLSLEGESSTPNLIAAFAPLLLSILLGLIFGAFHRVSNRDAALWADHAQRAPNTVIALLESSETRFANAMTSRACEVVISAHTSALSSLRLGYRSLIALVLLFALIAGVITKPKVADPAYFEPPVSEVSALDPLEQAGLNMLMNNADRLLSEQGSEELAEALSGLESLAEGLQEGELSEGQALAKSEEIRRLLDENSMGEIAEEALKKIAENPELVERFQDMVEQNAENPPSDPNANPSFVELAKSLGGDPDTNRKALEELVESKSDPARRLRQGDAEGAKTTLRVRDVARERNQYLRDLTHGKTNIPPAAKLEGLLLKDLEGLGKLNPEKAYTSRVRRTDVGEVVREEDFSSRPRKLPPHLAHGAKRYFGKD